ncbi:MAG: DNA polymerase III subunit gamma/tau [Oscillospiraceae bacterium]|nr:DNA polymerase III subunit gamma/tau [Oscillospiraceae bacterium]
MYRVLYRQYRPLTFAEVAGQEHVTTTLSAQLTGNRLGHAYLFTGSRGTGKTTCAKILSRAVNCEHPTQTGDPCNECPTCRGILEGTILDVTEMDAASNNSVDNIRELKDEADFPPVRAKYRVYIIDEVHMLSVGAFNALLKILEEPPAHVIFILATTEVHKIPATILSRCQRFDFRRILPDEIAARLQTVATAESITLQPEAALLIARIADGALRDALSLLDGCIAVSTDVTEEVVSRAAGVADRAYLFQLTDTIAARDTAAALQLLHALYVGACDMERLCSELLFHFRSLMLLCTVPDARDLVVCTEGEYALMQAQAARFTLPECIRTLRALEKTLGAMKYDSGKRLLMELALVKLCAGEEAAAPRPAVAPPVGAHGMRPAVPTATPTPAPATPPPPAPVLSVPTAPASPAVESTAPPAPETSAPAPQPPAATAPADLLAQLIARIRPNNTALAMQLQNATACVTDGQCVISSPNPALQGLMGLPINSAALAAALEQVCGRTLSVTVQTAGTPPPRPAEVDPLDAFAENLFK